MLCFFIVQYSVMCKVRDRAPLDCPAPPSLSTPPLSTRDTCPVTLGHAQPQGGPPHPPPRWQIANVAARALRAEYFTYKEEYGPVQGARNSLY